MRKDNEMKVEFKDNQLFGVSLYVKTSEFKKIKNNDEEMESLIDAIDAFYTWRAMGFSIKISNMISSTYKQIKKNNGVVVFTREYDEKNKRMYFNVYLVSNGGVMQILYED